MIGRAADCADVNHKSSRPIVTPIRPDAPQGPPGQTPRPDAARSAAQKAFFDAAMGRAKAPNAVAATPAFALAEPIPRPQLRPDPAAAPPTRVLRPGSLLDIRV
ncbi:hypothetical protein [Phenylobacterium sp.]|uniref:hypothetical protein n=1 Tax=Phenylobacterium sp. TaxID=1871053 RepID=UPI00286B946F|nr:hypothetical protein [Phenylobacterium sp.]